MRRATIHRDPTVATSIVLGLALAATSARAEDFAVAASPPRFELSAKPGTVVRGVLEVGNAAPSVATYAMKTADWKLDRNAGALFDEDIQAGSCRPWVAIERHQIVVPGHGSYRFRFEVATPASSPPGECRFAIMIEGAQSTVKTKSGLNIPVAGRVGVIVYVDIGGARPELAIASGGVAAVNGQPTPVLQVRNTGAAHGRLDGFLSGVDAQGTRIDFAPSTLPILPGETRTIPLLIDQPAKGPPIRIAYPITIRGKLSWSGGSTQLSQQFAP